MAQEIEDKIDDGTTVLGSSTAGDVEKGGDSNENKPKVRTGDKDNEVMVLPKNRLVLVFIGLMLTVFLAALDQTIVCTSPFLDVSDHSDCASDDCARLKGRSRLFMGRHELPPCFSCIYSTLWKS